MEYNQVRVGAVNVPRDFNCEVCDFCKNGHCLIFDNLLDCKKAKLKDMLFNVGDTVYTNSCRWLYRDGGGYKILKLKITKAKKQYDSFARKKIAEQSVSCLATTDLHKTSNWRNEIMRFCKNFIRNHSLNPKITKP